MTVRASEQRHPDVDVCSGRQGYDSDRGGARRSVHTSSLVAHDASCMCERAELHEVAVTRETVCNTVVPQYTPHADYPLVSLLESRVKLNRS